MDTSIREIPTTSAKLGDKQTTSAKLGEKTTTSAKLGEKTTTSAKLGDKQTTIPLRALAVACAAIAGGFFLFSSPVLLVAGRFLIRTGTPRTADAILVIGGDFTGERILEAAELEREGYAPVVLMSGGGSVYGFHETDLELKFIHDHGYTAGKFIQFRYPAQNTEDEAEHVVPEMRRMGVHRYLLVTSPPHTARAGRVFRRVAPDLDLTTIACPDRKWVNGRWWKSREGRKEWLLELAKTFADWFRL